MNHKLRLTNIEANCTRCGKQFRLFSDDGSSDTTIYWNYCPHCGYRNDIWIRILTPQEAKYIPSGVGACESYEIRQKFDKEHKNDVCI